ncbi:hypothetical protein F7734_35475 [Scytonema sp. UIC 10036]|uniref:hypothetical protein n=1 Tax=Scytonema sp. UIC 10036 TaxID=2304196 RepID=UPI0012DA57AB|nr:hypothetical protein [Scytonema sp. UIC 10036]MUG97346.1 hypothetical protein [Scytonema sp. UIC 10036]
MVLYQAQLFTWLLALLAFSQPVAAALSESQALLQGLVNSKQSSNAKLFVSNSALVSAIGNTIGSNFNELFVRIEFFSVDVDLNNGRNKKVIVYTAAPQCGVKEASGEAQIALLKSRSNVGLIL